jgi:tetratricopeptide (TPR) repeat protein
MRRRLNIKPLAILLGACLALLVVVVAIHRFQVQRSSRALLDQAKQAQKIGDVQMAMSLMDRYLRYHPEDTGALYSYGKTLADDAIAARSGVVGEMAVSVLDRVLGREPGNTEARRAAMKLNVLLDRAGPAQQHAEEILKIAPNKADAEAETVLGIIDQQKGRDAAARVWYQKALAHDPKYVEAARQLAVLLRTRLNQPADADKVIDAIVAANDASAEAHLLRAQYLFQYAPADNKALLETAAADAARAVTLDPENVQAALVASRIASRRADWNEARRVLAAAVAKRPLVSDLYLELAAAETAAGQPNQGIDWLQKGIKALPTNPDLRWVLADQLVQVKRLEEAQEQLNHLRDMGYDKGRMSYVSGRLAYAQQKWTEAARHLESAIPLLGRLVDLATASRLLLASCYQRLGDTDRQYEVYRQLASGTGNQSEALGQVAASLEAMGRLDEALAQYRKIERPDAEARIAILRLSILLTLRQTPARRQWDEVTRLLDDTAKALPDDPRVVILRSEVLFAQDKFDEARRILQEARRLRPKEFALWGAEIALAERRSQSAQIPPLLAEIRKQFGDTVDVRLMEIRYATIYDKAAAPAQLAAMSKGIEAFTLDDQVRLLRGIVEGYIRLDQPREALAVWKSLADDAAQSGNIVAQVGLFDLGLLASDLNEMNAALQRIQKLEGADGILWRFVEAQRDIWRVREAKAKDKGKAEPQAEAERQALLRQARVRLTEIGSQRPNWSRIPRALGQIDEFEENFGAAIDHYQTALNQGDRDLALVRRLLALMSQERRYGEAKAVLSRIQSQSNLTGDLQRVASELFFRTQDPEQALAYAEKAVADGSTDYLDYLWLSQIRYAMGRRADAEQPLRKAIELAPDNPAPYVALVQYLDLMGQLSQAEQVVAQVEKRFPADKDPITLAQCYETIGQGDKARELYQQALARDPENIKLQRSYAGHLVGQNRRKDAEAILDQIIEKSTDDDDKKWARNLLLIILASDPDPARVNRSLEIAGLLDENATSPARLRELNVEDLRAKAKVLAVQQDPRRRQQAVTVLEEIVRRDPISSGRDLLLLAQLDEVDNRWEKAEQRYLRLLDLNRSDPTYLVGYIQALLRHDRPTDALKWIDELDKVQPDSAQGVQLRAMALMADKKPENAARLLGDYARRFPELMGQVGRLLDQMGMPATAESLLKEHASRNRQSNPQAVLLYAEFLGHQGRVGEAIDLCEQALKNVPAETVLATAVTIVVGHPEEAQIRRVEAMLQKALADRPNATSLQIAMALLRTAQGRYSEAQTVYKQVIERDSGNLIALNNLAWLVGLHDRKGDEAIALVDRAIAQVGRQPSVLDTRGVIYLTMGRNDDALQDLQSASAQVDDPLVYFHLARAYLAVGNRDQALKVFEQAEKLGLRSSLIDPLERPVYPELAKALGKEVSSR